MTADAESTHAPLSPAAARNAPARGFLPVLAVCTAVTASTIYLAAPLLHQIADSFDVTPSAAGWIVSIAQFGYAAGLILFVPLGDSLSRRRMIAVLSLISGAALAVAGASPDLKLLACAVLLASATTTIPQLLVPLVSERAPQDRRGRYVAALICGMFTGWVAARVLGGLAGQAYGWRAVYVTAGVLTVLVGLAAYAVLPPESRPRKAARPLAAIGDVVRALATSAPLRRACLSQGSMYGAWSALWTTLALLLTDTYHWSTASAGLFGLFGLAASAVAPISGGLVDRLGARRVVEYSFVTVAVSVPFFWFGDRGLAALCVAGVLIHAGLVAGHVANQTRALTATDTPSTANTAYVVAVFGGGATASAIAPAVYGAWHWHGACALAVGCLALGVIVPLQERRATASRLT